MISVAQALEERLAVVAGRHPELVSILRWLLEHRTSNMSLKGFVYELSQEGTAGWDLEAAASEQEVLGNHFLFRKSY